MKGFLQRLGSRAIGEKPEIRPVPGLYRGEATRPVPLDVPQDLPAAPHRRQVMPSRPPDTDEPRPAHSVHESSAAKEAITFDDTPSNRLDRSQRAAPEAVHGRIEARDSSRPTPRTRSPLSRFRESCPQISTADGVIALGAGMTEPPPAAGGIPEPPRPGQLDSPTRPHRMPRPPIGPEDPLPRIDATEPLLSPLAWEEQAGRLPGWTSGAGGAPARGNTPTEVHVTIGRIEVTALQEAPKPPVRPSAERPARMTLDDYLASRRRQGR